ncbi:hypothetical protein [Streptomyces sp. 142MFCol3.1]|uniref:hypothetical protein n=1 Tax=Streptomyces sp. 142MFCol3.1 TaxID=1172179 RepID=UPI00048DD9A1|nr:hypothetical protein [Streptomyces sp. 142MFCol3.1]
MRDDIFALCPLASASETDWLAELAQDDGLTGYETPHPAGQNGSGTGPRPLGEHLHQEVGVVDEGRLEHVSDVPLDGLATLGGRMHQQRVQGRHEVGPRALATRGEDIHGPAAGSVSTHTVVAAGKEFTTPAAMHLIVESDRAYCGSRALPARGELGPWGPYPRRITICA